MHTQEIISSPYLRSPYIKHILRATTTTLGNLFVYIHTFIFNSIQLHGSSIGSQHTWIEARSMHVCRQEKRSMCCARRHTQIHCRSRPLPFKYKCNMYVRAKPLATNHVIPSYTKLNVCKYTHFKLKVYSPMR